jgi:two-component system, NarL family, response regulator LiaR
LTELPVRVVLADDEAAIRSLTKYWLEADGRFRVVGEARDGSECITVCAEKQPDLVLLDLVMPKMGGLPALPMVREASPLSTVVVLSMLQEEKSIQESLHKGAAAFLDKGLDGTELTARLWEILGKPSLTVSDPYARP